MRIVLESIAHADQRVGAGQVGDWFRDGDGTLCIRVSETGDDWSNACVAVHELIEALVCEADGVSVESVDAFDRAWEPHDGIEEAGDDPFAPYRTQHAYALGIEMLLAAWLHVPWHEHARRVDAL